MPPLTRQEFIENILEPLNQKHGWDFVFRANINTFGINVFIDAVQVGSIAKDAIETQNVRGITMALTKWWSDGRQTLHQMQNTKTAK